MAPDDPNFGIVSVVGLDPGSTAKFTCNDGYSLNGADVLTCQTNCTWDKEPPTCHHLQMTTKELQSSSKHFFMSLICETWLV